jgi:hypothetical protein
MLGRVALTNKLVSKSMGLEERLVESVMDFCYKEWATEFKDCKHPYLYVQGLGTYGVNLAKVNGRIVFLLGVMRRERDKESRGVFYKNRATMIEGIRKEIFNLFEIRRNVRALKRNNTKLRRNGKALINLERKLVQSTGKESGDV